MRRFLAFGAVLVLGGCQGVFHQFEPSPPSKVAQQPPPRESALGLSQAPYTGIPKYLAEARPLLPTTSAPTPPAEEQPCTKLTRECEDRLRAVLATIDGQILALSTPPTELQLATLRTATKQLGPLLVPFPDMAAEREELVQAIETLPTQIQIDQAATRRRMIQLTDLIRVQLAAAQ